MSFSLLFPGQGSQYNGMFKEHFSEFIEFKEAIEIGEDFYKENLTEIILNNDERISDTFYTQPILLIISYACFRVWKNRGCPDPKVALGHSLGEVSAYLCSGALSYEDALKLIRFRASFMIESKGDKKTKMSAVLGLDSDEIEKILGDKKKNFLEAVNFNSPTQTVIAGNADEIESIKTMLTEKGAKRIIDLSVSVPSHSSMMNMASTKLKLAMDDISFKGQNFSVINNLDAKVSITESEVKDKLSKQISNPVQWVDSMKRLKKYSNKRHIEFGPGKVLSGLAKQNRVEGEFNSVDNLEMFLKLLEEYGS